MKKQVKYNYFIVCSRSKKNKEILEKISYKEILFFLSFQIESRKAAIKEIKKYKLQTRKRLFESNNLKDDTYIILDNEKEFFEPILIKITAERKD